MKKQKKKKKINKKNKREERISYRPRVGLGVIGKVKKKHII